MGRFSTTLNVKCADFVSAFTELMKKRGYETCKEDEAALSYLVAQGGEWATCACSDYNGNPQHAGEDADFFANELKTPVIFVEIVDSDFAILKMNGDEVIAGDGSGYGIEDAPKGSKAVWEPLLVHGTFEELTDIWSADEVFVEDALCRSAPLLGIDPNYICADHRDLSEMPDDANITALCFKKIGAGKPMTFNAGFIKVFGEGLEPYGFMRLKKTKNTQPYFARVINGDILQVVTYRTVSSNKVKYKCIEILGGAVTLYRRNLDFLYHELNPQDEMPDIRRYYAAYPEIEVDEAVMKSVVQYNCDIWNSPNDAITDKAKLKAYFRRDTIDFLIKSDDNEEMLKGLGLAFDVLKSVTLTVLNKITDLNSCIDYLFRFRRSVLGCHVELCPFDEFVSNERYGYSHGLALVKAGYGGKELQAIADKDNAEEARLIKEGLYKITWEEHEARCKRGDEYVAKQSALLEELGKDSRVLDELERVKAANTELLRSYGLDV
ncbi:MAG: hypothetical protein K2J77_12590 [Oscillospiraceae bacterium]|nr:hypothetical protein [Oscillospiraceae bacterium]